MTQLLCAVPTCRHPGRHNPGCVDDNCRGCLPARAADGLQICWFHVDRLKQDPVAAAELHAELALMLVMSGQGGDGVRQKNPGQGLALRPEVAEHRATIRHTLVSWVLLVSEERGIGLPWRYELVPLQEGVEGPLNRRQVTDESTRSLGVFLATHAQWLAAQDFAGEAVTELAELVSLGRSLRQPSDTKVVQIGPCPRKREDDNVVKTCGGTLRALLRKEASLLPSAVQCDADEAHTWSSSEWRHLGREMRSKA